jgi:hypothetical protein
MSLAVLRSRALAGMEALCVSVEVHLANGVPGLTIVCTNAPNFAHAECASSYPVGPRQCLELLNTFEQGMKTFEFMLPIAIRGRQPTFHTSETDVKRAHIFARFK